jgi:Gene product 88
MTKSPRFLWDGKSYPLLTWTSTMDCWSWSLPAGKRGSCPMEDFSVNSICNSCYAQQNRYRFRTVREAQWARFNFLRADPRRCLTAVGDFINDNHLPFFRVHDSGDFHTIDMIYLWQRVASACPTTRFWFPTRAWLFPHWIPALRDLASLTNVSVRPSAIHFGDHPPVVPGLNDGTVSMRQSLPGILDCPKSVNHTSCATEKCRTCWSKQGYVNYIPHGNLLPQRKVPLTIGATS